MNKCTLSHLKCYIVRVWGGLKVAFQFCIFMPLFFFLRVNSKITVQGEKKILFTYCSYTVYVLFTGPTTLFTHLKIILLQCFQFSVSATISSIQTDPIYYQASSTSDGVITVQFCRIASCSYTRSWPHKQGIWQNQL